MHCDSSFFWVRGGGGCILGFEQLLKKTKHQLRSHFTISSICSPPTSRRNKSHPPPPKFPIPPNPSNLIHENPPPLTKTLPSLPSYSPILPFCPTSPGGIQKSAPLFAIIPPLPPFLPSFWEKEKESGFPTFGASVTFFGSRFGGGRGRRRKGEKMRLFFLVGG